MNAQSWGPIEYEDHSSVRFGTILYGKNPQKIKQLYIAVDFLQEIDERDFYIGGSLSFIVQEREVEKKITNFPFPYNGDTEKVKENKIIAVYPEVYIRKYFNDIGFCPYVQLNAFYPNASLDVGLKTSLIFFDLEASAGYMQPFFRNSIERYPYIGQGFKFSLGVTFNIETWTDIFNR